jgi:hypothetical protein
MPAPFAGQTHKNDQTGVSVTSALSARWKNRSVGAFFMALAILALMAGCAPLTQEEIDRLARDSNSIRPLAESLARADDGSVRSLDGDRFVAELSARTLSREQFVSTLSTHCDRAHGGRLMTDREAFPLADKDIQPWQLESLAGRNGPITDYLGDALNRTLNSDVSRMVREVEREAVRWHNDDLYRQASVLCISYGDNGLLRIHYLVNYLTEDDGGGGDPFWAVATEQAFRPAIERQRELAETAANRAMWDDRETVEGYQGSADVDGVGITLAMARPGSYGYDFQLKATMQNGSQAARSIELVPTELTASDGRQWSVKYQGVVHENRSDQCQRESGSHFRVAGNSRCEIRLRLVLDNFDMPNMLITTHLAGVRFELSPRTRFQLKHPDH